MSDSENDSEVPKRGGRHRAFVDDKQAASSCKEHFGASTMVSEIKEYVRNILFPESKFPPCDRQCETLILYMKKQFHVQLPEGVSNEFFASHWSSTLKKNVTLCRHNAQTLARKNFLEDNQKEKVPARFSPNKFLEEIVDFEDYDAKEQPPYRLRQSYRRTPEHDAHFKYFVDRILSAVSPKLHGFRRKRKSTPISNIFTASDEAFALLFLLNEHHCWITDTRGGTSRTKKKFTDSKNGSQQGWSVEARWLYEDLVNEIKKRRKEQDSIVMEQRLIRQYKIDSGEDPNRDLQQDKENQGHPREKKRKWNPNDSIDQDSQLWKVMMGIIK